MPLPTGAATGLPVPMAESSPSATPPSTDRSPVCSGDPAASAITGLAETPDGHGYWLVGADGGVFSFGDAQFYGSLPGIGVQPTSVRFTQSDQFNAFVAYSGVVSLQPTPDGHGYWLVGPGWGCLHLRGRRVLRVASGRPGDPGRAEALGHAGALGSRAVVGTGHAAAVPVHWLRRDRRWPRLLDGG